MSDTIAPDPMIAYEMSRDLRLLNESIGMLKICLEGDDSLIQQARKRGNFDAYGDIVDFLHRESVIAPDGNNPLIIMPKLLAYLREKIETA